MAAIFSHRIGQIVMILMFGLLCAAVGAGAYRVLSKRLERSAISPTAQPMAATINLAKQHVCAALSPPISLRQVPATAARISVQVTDLNFLFEHGGGVVEVPSTGVIPEGALSQYFGPCPDSGEHVYRFRVNALDDHNKIVGIAETSLPCCSGL
jgi:hypothetical protein